MLVGTLLSFILFSGSASFTFADNDYASPLQQLKLGVKYDDILCRENHVLALRPNDKSACVSERTADEMGWIILTKQQIKTTLKTKETIPVEQVSSATNNTKSLSNTYAGRSFEETAYSQKSLDHDSNKMESIDFGNDWCRYDYYVYDGKYNQLWIQAAPYDNNNSPDVSFDQDAVLTYLATADFLYEEYSDLFGWEIIPGTPALRHVVCQDVDGPGTGVDGTFLGFADFADANSSDMAQTRLYGSLVHEYIHLWDFRGGIYLQGPDTAHAFTAGMEPIVHSSIGSGQAFWIDHGADATLPYDFMFNHWYKINLQRYLSDPQLNWETYFSDEAIAAEYGTRSIPENKERMLLQGGLLMSIYQMHGKEGLRNVFHEIDQMNADNPEWRHDILPPHQRTENFIKAVGDGLHVDAADYFDYWKYPISEQLRLHLSQYPASDKMRDNDGDGVSPIQGDFDDADPTIYPYAPEIYGDELDNNLDGLTDENVYRETIGSDFTSERILLPALIQGTISELDDEDSFTFTLNEPENIAITVFSIRGDKDVQEKINTYSGTIYLNDDWLVEVVPEWFMAPAYLTIQEKEPGTYTLRVTADNGGEFGITPNIGDYEIQIFVKDNSRPVDMTYDTMLENIYS